MTIVLVAAVARNGVIGRDNTLPWRLRSDLAHFKAVTWGRPIVMGRKTFVSIGRPLPGRTSIVVTRDPSFTAAGAVVAGSLPAALDVARGDALRRGVAEIMVVGGGDLYAQALSLASRLVLTEVDAAPEGDAFFPNLDADWEETSRETHAPGGGDDHGFAFVIRERRFKAAACGMAPR